MNTTFPRADYAALQEIKTRLTVMELHDVALSQAEARAYVWGYEDAAGWRISEFTASWEFEVHYATMRARWVMKETTNMPPIQDAWRAFLADAKEHGVLTIGHGQSALRP
jgi:hypothetical protein